MEFNFSALLSSKAKFETLETLQCQSRPMPLRHIALCCRLPIRSVQIALQHLTEDDLVIRTENNNSIMFSLNRRSTYYPLLHTIFEAVAEFRLRKRAAAYTRTAVAALEFNEGVAQLVSQARKNRHGHRIFT